MKRSGIWDTAALDFAALHLGYEEKQMVLYRRNYLAGGSYFFTVNLANRQSRLLIEHVDLLREAFRQVRNKRGPLVG